MVNLAYTEKYTVEDYNQWEGKWELVSGDAYAMTPSPLYGHQFVNLKIARQLDESLDNCKQCHAVIEMDLQISDDTVVRPDSMVICYEPDEKLTKRPELVFEVISKSTAKRDEILKFNLYQTEGVKYYILVYPESKKAALYKLIDFSYKKIGDFSHEIYNFELGICNIEFDFSLIWRK